jgi:hypothetical protein
VTACRTAKTAACHNITLRTAAMGRRNALIQCLLINVRRSLVFSLISPKVIIVSDRTYYNDIIEMGEKKKKRKDVGKKKEA